MTLSVLDALTESVEIDARELPCRLNDPELFFAESPADVESAKALCQTCPVMAECLAGAIARHEPWGCGADNSWSQESSSRASGLAAGLARPRSLRRTAATASARDSPTGESPEQIEKEMSLSMNRNDNLNWSNAMELMQENLARAHMEARLREARERGQAADLRRARRQAKRDQRAVARGQLVLARAR